jgi:hypothetical protein
MPQFVSMVLRRVPVEQIETKALAALESAASMR